MKKNVDPSPLILHHSKELLGEHLISLLAFGSRISGGASSGSDFDFLAICDDNTPKSPVELNEVLADIVAQILFSTGLRVSIILLFKEDFSTEVDRGSPFLASILTGYRILFDQDGFAARGLEALQGKVPITLRSKGRVWRLNRAV